jgi:hypothetical protein
MQKTAQKRSLLNKLREMTNVSGIATEKYFNPEFKQIMDHLRNVDDGVRAIAAGEQVGDASAPSDATSLKDVLKSIKSNLNRREYMRVVADLGRFHKKVYDIAHLLGLFKSNVDKTHEKFLFQDMDDETKKHLQDLNGRLKSASLQPYFVKEANLLDFFTNIATERGRALAAWEKRYPHKIKKLKDDATSLLAQSEKLLSIILSSLKDMAKARATRNPDAYINLSDKITNNFNVFENGDKGFKKFYTEHVKGFIERPEFSAPTKVDTTTKPDELGKKEVTAPPAGGGSGINPDPDQTITLVQNKPLSRPLGKVPQIAPPLPKIPQMPPHVIDQGRMRNVNPITGEITDQGVQDPDADPITAPQPSPNSTRTTQTKLAPAHKQFFDSLETLGEESPKFLAVHIARYAKSIQGSDPETALKLFQIVKSIKG